MTAFDTVFWFWNCIVVVYFFFKERFLSRVFTHKVNVHPLISLVIACSAVLLDMHLRAEYTRYLSLSPIIGSIQLPPFTLLYLLADFVSSVLLFLLIIAKNGPAFFYMKHTQTIAEVFRFIVISIVFTTIVSMLWVQEVDKQVGFTYGCFKNQIAIDLATYYYRNKVLPEKIGDFTQYKINPVNNSQLVLERDGMLVSVLDEKGNKIIDGYKDLVGIESYIDNPFDFFSIYRIHNRTLCKGSLSIPSEYD